MSASMIPDTLFQSRDEQKNLVRIPEGQCLIALAKVFRKYSRCGDASLTPLEHAMALKMRFNTWFRQSAEKSKRFDLMLKEAWTFAELETQLKTGRPSPESVNIGLDDKTIVVTAFHEYRAKMQPQLPQSELKRA